VRDVAIVTCFLLRRGEESDRVLLLRRSERVGTYRGRWAAVSGYLDPSAGSGQGRALEQAYREIEEETGLGRSDVRLLAEGTPLAVPDEALDTRWLVHPFLFEALRPDAIRLDWEHEESRWLKPEDAAGMETVPGLAEVLARVYTRP
jgi:8-oxo-dGTP pyrophosphatase MutT (NUDIX family)